MYRLRAKVSHFVTISTFIVIIFEAPVLVVSPLHKNWPFKTNRLFKHINNIFIISYLVSISYNIISLDIMIEFNITLRSFRVSYLTYYYTYFGQFCRQQAFRARNCTGIPNCFKLA